MVPVLDSAASIARLVRSGQLSATEVVELHLSRIDRLNPQLNAFVGVDAEGARAAARAADEARRSGVPSGPLRGVPVSIKSSISVAGMPFETGSRSRTGVRGEHDAPLVARLRAAGAIVLGVTNVAESLMAWETANPLYGRTNSPWALDRTPGGSSGGEAAAIAAGLSAGGIGRDGGGSIRVPAHFSGICGLKPTPGRVPATGHFPPCGGPFALTGVVGPMARTVADLDLLFRVVSGPDAGDPNAHPVPLDPFATIASLRRPDSPLVVGVFEDDGEVPVTRETRTAVRQAARWLEDAGLRVEPVRPAWLDEARARWWDVFGRASRLLLAPQVRGHEDQVHPNLVEFIEWTERDPRLTAEELLAVEIGRDMLRARMLDLMARVPILLCPVAPMPAFRHGERSWTIDGHTVHYLDAWRYSAWFNLLQNPGVAVPVASSSEGLPIGVQIAARPWDEAGALAVAAIVEEARGAWRPPPAPYGGC
jgi:Asp-tRNA(Asn)/Glu-tRNA(Gln) amidotransferase A subunit family amidase